MDRVQFDGVSKRYRLGQGRTNAREAVASAAKRLVHRQHEVAAEVWSLRDVSFTVGEGGALGIVGSNGAGKSTVLKILAGITSPTSGVARTRGRVAALLEVGTGFHPELSGRENVFLNGAILGMSRSDLRARFDEIVAFSGVERFLDTPVKRYSSGMYLRLAFAVAAHLDPDVLVVDEVLAVGDAEFQRRCLGHLANAERDGRSVLYVSHDLESLARLCPRALWLEAGRVRTDGSTPEVVRAYLSSSPTTMSRSGEVGGGAVVLVSVAVLSADGTSGDVLLRDEPIRIRVVFEVAEPVPGLDVAVYLMTSRGVRVLDEVLSDGDHPSLGPGLHQLEMDVPSLLNVGDFSVGVWFGTAYDELLDVPGAASFTLHGSHRGRADRILVGDLPMSVRPLDEPPHRPA